MKIQTKTALCFLACVAVPLLATMAMGFNAARNSITNLIHSDLDSVTSNGLEQVDEFLELSRTDIETWSKFHLLQDVLTDDDLGHITAELTRLSEQYPRFDELIVLNDRGLVVAAHNQRLIKSDFSTDPAFIDTMGGKPFARRDDASRVLLSRALVFAQPIRAYYDQNTVIGTLIGFTGWHHIESKLADVSLLGAELNDEHRLVLSTNAGETYLYDSSPDATLDASIGRTDIDATQANQVQSDDKNAWLTKSYSLATPLGGEKPWTLSAFVSSRAAYSDVYSLRSRFVVFGLMALLLCAALGALFAKSLAGPIVILAGAAERLSRHDFDAPTPKPRSDEIGHLTRSFESMRSSLQEHGQALQDEVEERKRTEAELIEAKIAADAASEMKSQFLANMSHEIRTPMNGVLGMTELVLATDLDDKQRKFAQTAYSSAESLLGVINDILDFSKIDAGKVELNVADFDLREIVEDVGTQLANSAHGKGLELNCAYPVGVTNHFRGDAGRIRQILYNLVGNAIKFTVEGEVSLRVEPLQRDDVAGLNTFEFCISDTGIGIEEDAQAHIFDQFQQADGSTTRDFGGTGLGLAISRQLVTLMGGDMHVESVVGQGSTFRFSIVLPDALTAVAATIFEKGELKGARILVVDDNATNREILEHQLDAWAATCISTESAEQALVKLNDAVACGVPMDLAIVDFQMPGTDGVALARTIKANAELASTRIVILSSVGDDIDDATCRKLGVESYISKPARQEELYRKLAAALRDSQPSEVRASNVPELSAAPPSNKGRLLLTEDNQVNQAVAMAMLESLGYEVDLAENGEQAVVAVASEEYKLVLMDCNMPIMDGFQATAAIREAEQLAGDGRHMTIIALTANAIEGDEQMCLEAGMDGYLSKPFSKEQLNALLETFLSSQRAA